MKTTIKKQHLVKLYDWLKTKSTTLKTLIEKKQFSSYSNLIDYCNKSGMLPCTAHDFEKAYNELYEKAYIELYPTQLKESELESKPESDNKLIIESIEEELPQIEKEEVEITPQKQSKKKN